MDVVYLYYENNRIRLPLYGYDRALFDKLFYTRIPGPGNSSIRPAGWWDAPHHQFIANANCRKALFALLDGRVCAEVKADVKTESDYPVVFSGLENVPWSDNNSAVPVVSAPPSAPPVVSFVPRYTAHPVVSPAASYTAPPMPPPAPDLFGEKWRLALDTELRSRKYSPRTREAYAQYNIALCRWLQKPPHEINGGDVTKFLAYQEKVKNLSASSMNLSISAIKFFYHQVLKKNIVDDQRRPRHDKRLPVIFSKAEVKLMFSAAQNVKHRLLLMMVYASGLRVSEVVKLKWTDVDFVRRTVLVNSGKGRKDRYTLLSEQVAEFLERHFQDKTRSPWVFPGAYPEYHLSIRSAQNIFKNALVRAKIPKDASIHSLRHAFATHLLESGIDIKYIQTLLGHASVRTTSRYTHVARRRILKIESPLDTAD
jgi:site-specific recombinase XerD